MRENRPGSDEKDRRERDSNVAFDEAETLIQKPGDFEEDYEEFGEHSDSSPDDRRRDPLRRKW